MSVDPPFTDPPKAPPEGTLSIGYLYTGDKVEPGAVLPAVRDWIDQAKAKDINKWYQFGATDQGWVCSIIYTEEHGPRIVLGPPNGFYVAPWNTPIPDSWPPPPPWERIGS